MWRCCCVRPVVYLHIYSMSRRACMAAYLPHAWPHTLPHVYPSPHLHDCLQPPCRPVCLWLDREWRVKYGTMDLINATEMIRPSGLFDRSRLILREGRSGGQVGPYHSTIGGSAVAPSCQTEYAAS